MLQGLDEIVAHLYPDHTTQKPIYILWLILHQTIPQSNETLNPKQKLLATIGHTGGTCMTPCTSTLLALVVGRPSSEEGGVRREMSEGRVAGGVRIRDES
jgi:hypothetical protein